MRNLLSAVFSLFTLFTFAQKTLFEAIEANGENAIYQRYYSVYEDDDGKQVVKGKQFKLKAKILKFDGVYAGVSIDGVTKDDSGGITVDATRSKSSKIIGYPNVSLVVDRISRKGIVVIDDFIFKLGNVWKEKGGIGFNDIDAIYIRVGADGAAAYTKDGKKKKKKKFGAFLSKVKNAAMNKPQSECTSPGCKKAESMDLGDLVRDYLRKMEAMQNAYTLTAQDKVDIAKINGAVDGYYEFVKTKNDAYWNSPEGKAIRNNQKLVRKQEDKHMQYCRLSKDSCGAVMHKD